MTENKKQKVQVCTSASAWGLENWNKTSNLVANTSTKRLKWLRNVITLEERDMASRTVERKPESRRAQTETARRFRKRVIQVDGEEVDAYNEEERHLL
jgi:hypothetical protein